MSKANWGKEIYKDVKARGWVEKDGVLHLPDSPEALQALNTTKKRQPRTNHVKTGWIDDTRNIKNKSLQTDPFIMLIDKTLSLNVWPEFFFSTDRLYRFDYAIPVDREGKELKIALEVQGGVWAKGNSGHSSGTGIMRDMDKANLAQSLGWSLIQVTPSQLMTGYTIDLVGEIIKGQSIS